MSHSKKYPIGTKIRFIGKNQWDDFFGKYGSVVDIINNYPVVYLPKSKYAKDSCFSTTERPATIQCAWIDIEHSLQKGEQLLFGFMHNG